MSLYFSNDKKIVEINMISNMVSYNDSILSIKTVGFMSRNSGKIQAGEYVFSWSKGELRVYNLYKEQIDIYYSQKDIINTSSFTGEDSEEWIATFELKKGHLLYFYKILKDGSALYKLVDILEKKEYLLTLKTDSKFIKEYIDNQGHILYTNDKIPSYRWMNIPIGKM